MGFERTVSEGEILTSISSLIEVLSGGVLNPHWADAVYQCCAGCNERLNLRAAVRDFLGELAWGRPSDSEGS
ncbi:MAG: hypothetical protein JKY65_27105 [Planctomycetes bacterium]|nr:hypothetical protein [Planctomycetota bacterium]